MQQRATFLVFFAVHLAAISAQCTNQICPLNAPYHQVTKTSDADNTYITTSTCPPYVNQQWTNPNTACYNEQTYTIPKNPVFSKVPIPTGERIGMKYGIHYLREDPTPILGAIGVLVNGVVVYGVGAPCSRDAPCPQNGGLSNYVDAFEAEGHTLDQCGGHPDGRDRYHIHTGNNFTTNDGRIMCSLPTDKEGEHSELLGYMFDGFPLYGQYSQGGVMPTQLDSCQGHTHEINGTMQYHYHLPTGFPWMIGCFKGCPIVSNNPIQLNFNNNSTYGCPQGLREDPSPVYEDTRGNPSGDPNGSLGLIQSTVIVTILSLIATSVIYY